MGLGIYLLVIDYYKPSNVHFASKRGRHLPKPHFVVDFVGCTFWNLLTSNLIREDVRGVALATDFWSIGLLAFLTSDRLDFWTSGLLDYWSFDLLVFRTSGLLDFWSSGLLTIWTSSLPDFLPSGLLVFQTSGPLDFWSSGHLDFRTSGLPGFWTSSLLSRCPKKVLIETF